MPQLEYPSIHAKDGPNRLAWVDASKGIGIVLVVYGHVLRGLMSAGIVAADGVYKTIDSWIYTFHMPLFFFISGLFFCNSYSRQGPLVIASRIDTVAWPYVTWSIIQGLLHTALSSLTNRPLGLQDVTEFLWTPRAQFWFLYVLFLLEAAYTLLFCWMGATAGTLVGLALGLLLYAAPPMPPTWNAGVLLCGHAVFFSAGAAFRSNRLDSLIRGRAMLPAAAASFFLASAWYHADGWTYNHGPYPVRLVLGLLGIAALTCAAAQLPEKLSAPLAWVGRHSLEIYLMHILAGSGTRIALAKGLGVSSPAVHIVSGVAAGVALPLLAARFIVRLRLSWLLWAPDRFSARRRLHPT